MVDGRKIQQTVGYLKDKKNTKKVPDSFLEVPILKIDFQISGYFRSVFSFEVWQSPLKPLENHRICTIASG